jgi:hypothetical protein
MRQDPGIRLEEGRLAPTGVGAAIAKALPRTSLATRIGLVNAGLAALCLCVGFAGLNATDRARTPSTPFTRNRPRRSSKPPRTPPRGIS